MKKVGRRIVAFALCVFMLISAVPVFPVFAAETSDELVYSKFGNPYLPLWEYIPDSEPYVFEDPDNPGKYRLYIYGSHDTSKTSYCGYDITVWSAPVENLTQWTCEGIVFQSIINGDADKLFAPDVAVVINDNGTKTYYLYPNNQAGPRNNMVAKSDRPDGPFEVCNWAENSTSKTEGPIGFDPAAFVDDDGRAYAYWGSGSSGSYLCELDATTMSSLKEGTEIHRNIPRYADVYDDTITDSDVPLATFDPTAYNIVQDDNVNKWGFFEASSIRKVGNKYVFIYSRNGLRSEPTGKNAGQLAYGYSDSPMGPWTYGGIIVDSAGEVIQNENGQFTRTYPSGNTHGSICEINGQWYIFYHRKTIDGYARQGMVDPITVEWDQNPVSEGGKVRISMAEVTSNGFNLNGLDPYMKHSAGIASYLTGGAKIKPAYEHDVTTIPITNIKNGVIAGIKYFDFDHDAEENTTTRLEVEVIPKGVDATIDVYLRPKTAVSTPVKYDDSRKVISVGEGSIKVGSFQLFADMPQTNTTMRIPVNTVDMLDGQWGLFFVFNSDSNKEICDFYNVQMRGDNSYYTNTFDITPLEDWTTTGSVNVADGALTLGENSSALLNTGVNWKDYSVIADIVSHTGTIELHFNETDENNYYSLQLGDTGIQLDAVIFGQSVTLQNVGYSFGSKSYTLMIDAADGVVSVRINGALLAAMKDDSHNVGTISMVTGEGAQIVIDAITVENSAFDPTIKDDFELVRQILINDTPLAGFATDKYTYQIAHYVEDALPVITATSNDPSDAISISNVSEVPGTAYVHFSDASGDVQKYQLHFYETASKDQALGGLTELPDGWDYFSTNNESKERISFEQDGIKFSASANGEYSPNRESTHPIIGLTEPIEGEWQIETYFSVEKELNSTNLDGRHYEAAGIVILGGDKQSFVKFVLQNRNNQMLQVRNIDKTETNTKYTGTDIYMRVNKIGDTAYFYASSDGVTYTLYKALTLPSDFFDGATLQFYATRYTGSIDFDVLLKSMSIANLGVVNEEPAEMSELDALRAKIGPYIVLPNEAYADSNAKIEAATALLNSIDDSFTYNIVQNELSDSYRLTIIKNGISQVIPGMKLLVETANYKALTELITEVQALCEEDYTFATWNKLESALSQALSCNATSDITEIISAYNRLSLAKNSLKMTGESSENTAEEAAAAALAAKTAAEAAQVKAEAAQAAAEEAKAAAEAAAAETAEDKAAAEAAQAKAEAAQAAAEEAKAAAEEAKTAAQAAAQAAAASDEDAAKKAADAAKSASDSAASAAASAASAADAAKAQAAAQAAQASAEAAKKAAEEAEKNADADAAAAKAAKEAAEAAQKAAEDAKKAAEVADADAAEQAAASAQSAAEAAKQAAEAAKSAAEAKEAEEGAEAAKKAAEEAKAAAEAAKKAAEEAAADAAADKAAADAAKAAAELAQSRAEIAEKAAEAAQAAAAAANAEAAANAAKTAADAANAAEDAAEAAKAQAAAQIAQGRAEAAQAAAEAAQAKADEAAAKGENFAEEAKDAADAATKAQAAAEAAKKAADAAAEAADESNTAAAEAAAQAAKDAAAVADALNEVAAAKAAIAADKAELEAEIADHRAAMAAAELRAAKYYALTELAIASTENGAAASDVMAAKAAIEAAATAEDVDKALAEALKNITASCPSAPFVDAPAKDNWAHAGIDYCIEHELMNGTSTNTFSPNGIVSRAQLVTILYRVAGEPTVQYKATFTDVPDGQWYSKAIEWAVANDIVNGKGEGKFDPMGPVTREQIATILYRYSGSPVVTGSLNAFPDAANASAYAIDALVWATQKGLINGIKSGDATNLAPKDNATRAQIASIIMRFLEK